MDSHMMKREKTMKIFLSESKRFLFLGALIFFSQCVFIACSSSQQDEESFNFSGENSANAGQNSEGSKDIEDGWNNDSDEKSNGNSEKINNEKTNGNNPKVQGNMTNAAAANASAQNMMPQGGQGLQEVVDLANDVLNAGQGAAANLFSESINESIPTNEVANNSVTLPSSSEKPQRERMFYALKDGYSAEKFTPSHAVLRWVGYVNEDSRARTMIEMGTIGQPKFAVLHEINHAKQHELTVRFFGTKLRHKLRRDIDASEFHSPVAFIRMRENKDQNFVDVIMTLRDFVRPHLYAKNGNVLLQFPIPERYYGNAEVGLGPIGYAEAMTASMLFPSIEDGSDLPENIRKVKFLADPGEKIFAGLPTEEDEGKLLALSNPPKESGNQTGNGVNTELVSDESGNIATNTVSDPAMSELSVPDNSTMTMPSNGMNGLNSGGNSKAGTGTATNNAVQSNSTMGTDFAPPPTNMNNEGSGGSEDEDKDKDFEDFEDDSDSKKDDANFEVRDQKSHIKVGKNLKILKSYTLIGVAQDNNFSNFENNGGATGKAPAGGGSNNFKNVLGNSKQAGNSGNAMFGNSGNSTSTGNVGASGNKTNAPIQAPPAINNVPVENAEINLSNQNLILNNAETNKKDKPVKDNSGEKDYEMAIEEEISGLDVETNTEAASLARTINMDFRGAPLIEVIRAISDESGRNFILGSGSDSKKGGGGSVDPNLPVHLSLKDIPWTDALKALLETYSLGMVEVSPNVVRIDSMEQLIDEKKDIIESRKITALLTPKKTLIVRLSHARAEDMINPILSVLQEAIEIDKTVRVAADRRSNSLIIEAIPNDIARVKLLIERLDRPTPQVKIVSRIAEVVKILENQLGVVWGGQLNYDQARGLGFGTLPFPNYMTSNFAIDPGLPNTNSGFDMRFGSINNAIDLDLRLRLLEQKRSSKMLQTNTVYVADLQEAKILGGRTDYFRNLGISLSQSADGNQGMTQVKYHSEMTVKPQVTGDGQIQMEINIDCNEPTEVAPGADSSSLDRSLKTVLMRKNGETVVIGGLYNSSSRQGQVGIPYLSSLPIIGALFRQTTSANDERDLLIMLTPTIVNAAEALGQPAKSSTMAINDAGTSNQVTNDVGSLEAPQNTNILPATNQAPAAAANFGSQNVAEKNSGENAAQSSENAGNIPANNLGNGDLQLNSSDLEEGNEGGGSSMDDYEEFE